MKSAKAPKPTAADQAMIARQSAQLDEEMAKNEKRLKAVARGGLGAKSMLGAAGTSGKSNQSSPVGNYKINASLLKGINMSNIGR